MTTFDLTPTSVPAGATWPALGTTVHLLVTDPRLLAVARRAVAQVLADVDATYSRFRADSELRVLAADAGRDRLVSPLLARALGTALRAARATDGAVDPTIGRTIRVLGYDDDFARLPRAVTGAPLTLASVPGWRAIRFDAATRHVRIPAGVELDFGATGKGLAADLAAEAALDAMDGAGVLVSLGGDIATDGEPPTGGWRILLADDSAANPDGPGDVVRIHGGAIATSSVTVRHWSRGEVTRHHVLDPATGLPATGPWRTATVVAATCADANAAATAAIVMGDRAPAWLARHGLPARLVAEDGSVLRVAGWPEPPSATAAGVLSATRPASRPASEPALPQVTA
jgi:thiamine biosynthesis lipoprotein ApbE